MPVHLFHQSSLWSAYISLMPTPCHLSFARAPRSIRVHQGPFIGRLNPESPETGTQQGLGGPKTARPRAESHMAGKQRAPTQIGGWRLVRHGWVKVEDKAGSPQSTTEGCCSDVIHWFQWLWRNENSWDTWFFFERGRESKERGRESKSERKREGESWKCRKRLDRCPYELGLPRSCILK